MLNRIDKFLDKWSKPVLVIVLLLGYMWGVAWAANTALSGLTEDLSPTTDDLIVTTNDPGGTPASRKVTIANLITLIQSGFDSVYAAIANGVTNGDSHDHSGGDGAQIDHTGLSNIGTNTHAQVDSHITAHGSDIANLVEDTTPQLGGNLDLNGNQVGTLSAADLVILEAYIATYDQILKDFDMGGTCRASAPGTPVAGRAYCADGTSWNPGSVGKKHIVIYDGSGYVIINDEDGAIYLQSASVTPAMLSTSADDTGIEFVIDGGGSAITTGVKGFLEVPFDCTINSVTALADQTGSIVVDIWVDTYANYPPTDADSITAAAPVTISSAVKSQDTTLSGWTLTLTKGDIIGYNVDSAATVERVTISMKADI